VSNAQCRLHLDAIGNTLIAESNGTGQVGREYVWLNATPVAAIDNAIEANRIFVAAVKADETMLCVRHQKEGIERSRAKLSV